MRLHWIWVLIGTMTVFFLGWEAVGWLSPSWAVAPAIASWHRPAADNARSISAPIPQQKPLLNAASRDPVEQQLFAVLDAVSAGQLSAAIEAAESLVRQRPNFQLAHLVLADLYAIQAPRGVTVPPGREGLDRELRQRLLAALSPPPAEHWPEALLAFDPASPWAIVVDTDRSRLMLLKKPSTEDGAPSIVYDTFISVGKAGVGKRREGDNKTPLGVYDITGLKRDADLPDFYGAGALTLNYPNAADRWLQRTGYGIWLHGTPVAQYVRTPESSEGCVVLPNDHMQRLLTLPDIDKAPVIIAQGLRWISPAEQRQRRRALLDQLARQWPALKAGLEAAGVQMWRDPEGGQFARIALAAHDTSHGKRDVLVVQTGKDGQLTALTPEVLQHWSTAQTATPPAPMPPVEAAAKHNDRASADPPKVAEASVVANVLHGWANAWSRRDVNEYLSYYAVDFRPAGGISRREWEAQRRQAILGRQRIRVRLDIRAIDVRNGVATVRAVQHYEGDGKRLTTPKRFTLRMDRGSWRIVEERTT